MSFFFISIVFPASGLIFTRTPSLWLSNTSPWNSVPAACAPFLATNTTRIPGCASPIPMNPPLPSSSMSFPTTLSILSTLTEDSSYLLSIVRDASSDWLMHSVMTSMVSQICFMFSTMSLLEASTSFMAPSITPIFCPSFLESSVMLVTLTCVSFSLVMRIISSVLVMDFVIFSEVSSR